jgi:hypothetical protein
VLKFIFVPNPLNIPFQKFDVNLGSLSDTIVLGTPCILAISHMYISAMLVALCIDFTGIKWEALVSLSTTTII